MNQPQGPAKPIEYANLPTTYFMALALPSEGAIALAYLKKKYGNEIKAKKVTELRVDRLIPGMHVIVLMRRGPEFRADPRPMSPPVTYIANNGMKEAIYHKADEFADEVTESAPIAIADYFQRAPQVMAGEWGGDGELDKDRFFDALAASSPGATIKWQPERNPGIVKLEYN